MVKEHSAGAVIFNTETKEFLVLRKIYRSDYWEFPKGKIDKNETAEQAAVREVKEETNLDIKIIPGFKETIKYFFKEGSKFVNKDVIFFIAKTASKAVTISKEHTAFAWLSYEDALKTLTFKDSKNLLKKAKEAL